MDDVVAGLRQVALPLVLKRALVKDRVSHLRISGESKLAGVGVPALHRIALRAPHVHHRIGVVDVGAEIDRVGVVHHGELRVHRGPGGLDHEHLDLAGEIPVVELAVDRHLAWRGHGIELLVAAAAVVIGMGGRRKRDGPKSEAREEHRPDWRHGGEGARRRRGASHCACLHGNNPPGATSETSSTDDQSLHTRGFRFPLIVSIFRSHKIGGSEFRRARLSAAGWNSAPPRFSTQLKPPARAGGWRFRRRTILSLTLIACMLAKRTASPFFPLD